MCTGLEIAALAATAAGTGAQIYSQRQQNKALGAAAALDVQRKEKTAREAESIFNQQLGESSGDKALSDADAAAQQELAATQQLIARPNTGFGAENETQAMANATPVVKEAAAQTLAGELQRAEGQMKARATMAGLQRRAEDTQRRQSRAIEQMVQLGGFNRGWDQVAGVEQQAAKMAGANSAMIGDLLVGLGSAGLQYGGGAGAMGGAAGAGSGANAAGGLVAGSSLEQPLMAGASQGMKAPKSWGGYNYALR